MASNQTLTTKLVVEDEASKPTEAFAKKLEGLDGDTATIVLALKAAGVQQDLSDLLTDISRLDASDPTLTVKVEQAAQAKSELDDLSAKIQEINAAPVELDTKPAVQGVKDLGHEADQSRSVLANMVGNSAQDLGNLGGVAGTAGVAVGQLAEYAADGSISLSGLTMMAGPMIALGVATKLVSSYFADIAATKAFHKEQVTGWLSAMKEGATVVSAIRDDMEKTAKVEFISSGDVKDATGSLDRLKLTAQDFLKAVADPKNLQSWKDQRDAIKEQQGALEGLRQSQTRNWTSEDEDRLASLTKQVKDYNSIIDAANQKVKDGADAQALLDQQTRVYGDTAKKTTEATAGLTNALAASTHVTELQAQASQDAADAAKAQSDAMYGAAGGAFALHDAEAKFQESLADLPQKLKDSKGNLFEVRGALEDVAKSADAVAQANLDMARDVFTAKGETMSATQELDAWNQSMLTQAATAKGPAKQAILDYVGSVNQIPPEKVTEIQALLDQGKVDEANKVLADASKNREATVTAVAQTKVAQDALNALANQKYWATVQATVIYSNAPVAGSNNANKVGQNSASNQTFNVMLPAGARQADVSAALSRHTRRSGGRWGAHR